MKNPTMNTFVIVPAASVPVGSIVSIHTGGKNPCDGVVIEGSSAVDESFLTGESHPLSKCPGDTVSGGAFNAGVAQHRVKTTSTADDSTVAQLIKLVGEAQANSSPTEHLIDAFAKRYTTLVIIVALFMCTEPLSFG